jgi:hypothetical protein
MSRKWSRLTSISHEGPGKTTRNVTTANLPARFLERNRDARRKYAHLTRGDDTAPALGIDDVQSSFCLLPGEHVALASKFAQTLSVPRRRLSYTVTSVG